MFVPRRTGWWLPSEPVDSRKFRALRSMGYFSLKTLSNPVIIKGFRQIVSVRISALPQVGPGKKTRSRKNRLG